MSNSTPKQREQHNKKYKPNTTAVLVLFGGNSHEHFVSCNSAGYIVRNLQSAGYDLRLVGIAKSGRWYQQNIDHFLQNMHVDESTPLGVGLYPHTHEFLTALGWEKQHFAEVVVFPVLHGGNGEDGTLQGLLELSRIPYVGSSMLGSALAYDKILSKKLAQSEGITTVPSVSFSHSKWQEQTEACERQIYESLSLPVFVKPARTGSSIGIRKVSDSKGLTRAIETAARYSNDILVETAIDAQEIECSVIGNETPVTAPILGEILPLSGFYDYHAKYIDDSTIEIVVPARISVALSEEVRSLAMRIFNILHLHGMARVDFLLSKTDQRLYFNEVNTIPGFTEISLFPVMWQKSGMDAEWLLSKLLEFAQLRHARQTQDRHIDTSMLVEGIRGQL